MKNNFKLFGTQSLRFCAITLTTLFAFAITACNNGTTSAPLPGIPPLTGTVAITNNDKETYDVGDTLTANVSGSNVSDGFKYQWQSCDTKDGTFTDIPDATESTYEIADGMDGKWIRVVVSHPDYTGTITNVAVRVNGENILYGQVDIPWVIVIGQTVEADTQYLDNGGTISYQWMKSDDQAEFTDITGAIGKTFQVPNDLSGKYLQVVVSREGKTGSVTSNTVKVRAKAPIVTGVTINQSAVEVSKDTSYSFNATVNGTDLEDDDQRVIWDVGSRTSFNTSISGGWLNIGADEASKKLTVTVTSVLDSTKYAEAIVTVTEFSGNTITITGLGNMKGSAGIQILSGLDPDADDASVASGYADIADGSLTVNLKNFSGGFGVSAPWKDKGEYYIKLEGAYDSYVYTNGAAINTTNFDSNPKFDFQEKNTTIDFSKFAVIPLGAGGHQITISGLSNFNDAMAFMELVALIEDTEWGDYNMTVAKGHAVISSGSVTITLSDAEDYSGLTGWTGGVECFIKLSIDGTQGESEPTPSFVYTNGSSLTTLGITTWGDFYDKAPKVNFTSATTSVSFDKFVSDVDIGFIFGGL